MRRNRRTPRAPLVSSLRGRLIAVVGVLLALLAGWLLFGRSAGDEAAPPFATMNQTPARPEPSPSPTGPPSTLPPTLPPTTASPTARSEKGIPRRILLQQIAVSAQVIPISAQGGILFPPSNPRVVGWWSAGAQPGARTGSAVLTAHTVHTGGGAFDDLDKLRVGATVTVTTSTGRITYIATSVKNYPKQSLAKHATELFDQTTPGRLVLVTCEDWNGKIYLSNAVVIAEPVG
jgi:LPXTG-site transpeptidase (sortase) family protein